jgi:hypothetical protein
LRSYFIPALPDDNPYLPVNYKSRLRQTFAYDPALLKAYLEGDWDAFASLEDYLISSAWVDKAREIDIDEDDDALKIISNDVATKHGENFTTIMHRVGHTIKSIDLYSKIPTTETKRLVKSKYEIVAGDSIVTDADGVGEGVSDLLEYDKIGVLEFHGGHTYKAMDTRKFRNLRSQFYWIVAKKLEKEMYSFKELPQRVFELLRKQLCSIKIRKDDGLGRFQIETKDDMRARNIDSPDLADTLMMSEYAFWMGRMADVKPYAYR